MSKLIKDKRHLFYNLAIVSILLLGAVLRFYRMRDYLVFLGDEGRDMLVAKRMLIDHKFTLLGPITSTGGMYLGPIYYYFITPFLWLFGFDPVGPAVMVGIFGVATIYLIYKTAEDFFSKQAGLIAALLYATSPLVIIYSRSSWNPNILPFFSLLIIYSLLQLLVNRRFSWLFIAGAAFGVSLQLHYLALFFTAIFVIIFFLLRKQLDKKKLLLFLLGIFSTFWPYILFELRHQFPNSRTIINFVTKSGEDATFGLQGFMADGYNILIRIFTVLIFPKEEKLAKGMIFLLATIFAYDYVKKRNKSFMASPPFLLIFLWLLVSVLSYSFYQGAIYDYYFVPVFALPFLLLGIFFSYLAKKDLLGKIISLAIIFLIISLHVKNSPHRIEPNRLLDQTERIARFVYTLTEGKPYNFALISKGNSDHAYRYFLELWGKPPVKIENQQVDPERKTVTGTLIVVCEDIKCQPLGNSLWEIAGFGSAEVVGVWDVFPVKIVKMVKL